MRLVFSGRISDTNGKPVGGLLGLVQAFSMESGQLEKVQDFTTGDDGAFSGNVDLDQLGFKQLPFLALVGDGVRLVVGAPDIKASDSSRTLVLGFGDVTAVADTPVTNPSLLEHVDIHTLVSGLGTKLSDAGKSLGEAEQSRFRLGNVKVQVRGVVGADGLGIALNDHKATAAAGSVLEFELEQNSEETAEVTRAVPDLIATTPTLARRVLISIGLRLSSSSKTAAPGDVVGQCVLQSPTAGSQVPLGSQVLVVFATARAPEDS